MSSIIVKINEMLGSKNSYGYFAGEEYEVIPQTAVNYEVVAPTEKAGWKIYHAHCTEVSK